jgi:hypothetical protein
LQLVTRCVPGVHTSPAKEWQLSTAVVSAGHVAESSSQKQLSADAQQRELSE